MHVPVRVPSVPVSVFLMFLRGAYLSCTGPFELSECFLLSRLRGPIFGRNASKAMGAPRIIWGSQGVSVADFWGPRSLAEVASPWPATLAPSLLINILAFAHQFQHPFASDDWVVCISLIPSAFI